MFRKYIKISNIEHPFLLSSIVISLFLAICTYLIFAIYSEYEKYVGLIFILPTLLVILISTIAYKTSDKNPILTKIISSILNSLIIIVVQVGYGLVAFFILALCEIDHNYDTPDNYSKALNSICYKEYIQHFPSKIPNTATDVVLYKTSSHWFGSEEIILKFKTNEYFINKELAKYSYTYIETPEKRDYRHNNFNYKLSMKDFTLYIINDYLSKKVPQIGPYQYGIAINHKSKEIAYYYINPD